MPVTIKNGALISAFLSDLYDNSINYNNINTLNNNNLNINNNNNNNNNVINSQYSKINVLNKNLFSVLSMNNSEIYYEKQLDLVKHRLDDLIELQI